MARKAKAEVSGGRTVVSHNMATGQRTERPYTPEEDAEADAVKAAWEKRPIAPVSPYQLRIALVRSKKLDAADKAAKAAGGEALVMWEYAATVERGGALGRVLEAALGAAATDEAFRDAEVIA